MNQRICELIEQATEPPEFPANIGYFNQEKFAELIVEECMYVIDCNKGSDQHTEWNRALFETIEKFKEHFEVEL